MTGKTFRGTVFDAPTRHELRIVRDALVKVSDDGVIEHVLDKEKEISAYKSALAEASRDGSLVTLGDTQYIMPGFVDLHVHAPQWPQLGKALDCPLEEWLQKYTFPLEARYSDVRFARRMYSSLVKALLSNGTTTAAYFATVHVPASIALGEICLEYGQRAIIGRVAMDLEGECPSFYRDASAAESVRLSEEFIQRLNALPRTTPSQTSLVLPAVVPRFIPTCSDEALVGLSALAREHKCHILTHCSESDWEHNHVLQRCGKTDTTALRDMGLLTRHTVLAHSVYISENDMVVIGEHGSSIAHCPLSNVYFSQAVFPLYCALARDLHVGLGTDISGGPSASMLDSCRSALTASRLLESGTNPQLSVEARGKKGATRISTIDAFYTATAGGGIALDLKIGLIEPGYYFDAIVVDTSSPGSDLGVVPDLDNEFDVFHKVIYNATRANIAHTYVNGRLVSSQK